MPEKGTDFYDVKDVPHGQVRAFWYHSKVTGAARRAFVYTPPGYDANPARRYPVLYLQHGAGEDERGWGNQGRANVILDNLLAVGKAKPMLVVMDNGYATPAGAKGNAFEDVVLRELVPGVDAEFRTLAERTHRAIAGLSMGAGQALQIGLTHPDTFSYVGAFSGAGRTFDVRTAYGGAFQDAAAFNGRFRLLWIGAGTGEEAFHKSAKAMHAELERVGVRSVFVGQQGTAHEWQTWRRALYDFAPRLFNE
ncbi:MAG TPA: alpha/beta hydrolase-fold protein [Urbifossiella sp.]|nr:alpha/beta hydrolase-fold protein [Urbifossiella sp.]